MDNDEVNFGEGLPTQSEFQEEAIPLVIYNDELKLFELNEEGRGFLEKLSGPIGIIAVAGMYRTGKSYLLNRMLLDRSNGFGVGPTINPCTKGVWLWGKPIKGTTPDGDPITVLVMDTEGLGALDEDSNHDVRIFSLAILLSSYFIYNSVGSIDENALQNLSLVINLTKHIQIKASGIGQEDIDPEEYAKYFPSFMWIVRDFTLQLVDGEGEQISSKEYLEKALSNQKGFSDSVEQKNRIRRLLKSFFTDRDAVTMIRPLTDETRLQDLINIPMEELRPEFVEQIHILRRKVLQRIKPKKLNGKCLNGTMFWNLMKSYVESINKGAIPSIESSWAYICKSECLKAQEDAFELYRKLIAEELANGGPFYEHEIKEFHQAAKQTALNNFQKVAVGEVKEKFLEDLKEKMKQKFTSIKQDNDQSCEQECIMFLRQSYTDIERALKNQQYPSFIDYLHDMEQFKQIFEVDGPPGTHRKEILLDFCLKAVMESAEFFIGNVSNEAHLQSTMAQEAVKKLQDEIKEVKSEQKDKYEQLETKLRKTEIQNAELAAREQSTREQLTELDNDKNQLENNLNSKFEASKKSYERQFDELQQRVSKSDDIKKEIQRQQTASESEFDKQKALLDQKIEFLEKALEDSNKREKDMSTELKNSKKEFLSQNREQNLQLEKQIKDQIKQIDQMKEVIYEHESKNSEMEIEMGEMKSQLNEKQMSSGKELQKAKDSELDTQKKLNSLLSKYEKECQQLKVQQANEASLLKERNQDLESTLKETQETFDMAKQSWAKDEAVLKQKVEFIQYQLEDEKKKAEESEKTHQSMIASIHSSNRESVIGRTEVESKMAEREQQFLNDKKSLEDQYNGYRQQMKSELENLKKKCNEVELAKKIKDQEYTKDVGNLKDLLLESEQVKEQAVKQLKTLEHGKGTAIASIEEEYQQKLRECEIQLEEKEQEIDKLILEHNEHSEKKLTELKRFYDEEKDRLERRITEEKNRQEKKLNQTIEDYEEKIQEMTNNHEEAYNCLEEEKNNNEDYLQGQFNQFEKENKLMQQQIESKDAYLAELKANYTYLQDNTNSQNDLQSEKFSKERKELTEKIEQLTSEVAKRERAIVSLENQKESYANQLKNKEQSLQENKADILAEKNSLIQKIEDLKSKYDTAMDELTQGKIDQERDKALKDQKINFQEQRLGEYQVQMQSTIDRYEERLKCDKEDAQKILEEKISRIQQEKENVETKYEQKRKALKELEKHVQQSASAFEKERAVQKEKYDNLEKGQRELIKTYEIENQKLQESNDQLNMTLSQGELGVRMQIDEWKGEYQRIEREYNELKNEFDKDKTLWEDKFEFHKKQKDQAKKDQEEALIQFQQTIDQLQKTQNESKNKHNTNHQTMISQLQEKYKNEMQLHSENSANQINQLEKTLKNLERENKTLQEKVELSNQQTQSEGGMLGKKIEKIMEDRDRTKEEYDQYRADREKKIDDLKRTYEREKELLKQKNADLQYKAKNVDSKQTELILSHETNRAKWDQEKSYLLTAKEDALSEMRNIQRKYENQLKEVERLKEKDKKSNWRMQNNKRIGGMETNNAMMFKLGENIAGKFNLGSLGGAGQTGRGTNNELTQSQNQPISGLGSTFRSTVGVDKSMDNFKSGFTSKYGLGSLGSNVSQPSNMKDRPPTLANPPVMAQKTVGATPAVGKMSLGLGLGGLKGAQTAEGQNDKIRMSNLMSTPSSKGGKQFDDDDE